MPASQNPCAKYLANIAKVESRGKIYFHYAETKRINARSANIAKVESRSKACFDYAETWRICVRQDKYTKKLGANIKLVC